MKTKRRTHTKRADLVTIANNKTEMINNIKNDVGAESAVANNAEEKEVARTVKHIRAVQNKMDVLVGQILASPSS